MSDEQSAQHVGLIGLGLLGKALAQRLIASGYMVTGYDIEPTAREAAAILGVAVVDSPDAVSEACATILLSLPNSEIRTELLFGETRWADTLAEGTLLLDTTTGRAEDLERDAERLRGMDIYLVDVCVLASSAQVGGADAVLLVGDGEARAVGYAPVLACFAPRVFYLGKPGDGCRMKLVANQVVGLNRLVLAEALGLAEHVGLNPETTLDVLQSGLAASAVMVTKGRKMLERDFEPVARLAQHAKDVDLILEMGGKSGANLPLSALHHEILQGLIADGHGAEDNSVVVRAFRGKDR